MDRKEAIRNYKEQKIARGVFAVRCEPTGHAWVDWAMDLRAAENRTWMQLRYADHFIDSQINDEFKQHGRDAFTYEVLETLPEDIAEISLRDSLKERKVYWVGKLGARALSPM